MVSAGAGNKKAFGLDRISNSWADLKHAEVIMICGSNVSETFPTLTQSGKGNSEGFTNSLLFLIK